MTRKMMRSVICLLTALLIMIVSSANPSPIQAQTPSNSKAVISYDHLTLTGLTLLANDNDAEAILRLAKLYYFGNGVDKNIDISTSLAKQSAELNNPEAQFMLGLAYSQGNGIEKDLNQAFQWFKKASKQGYIPAQIPLANAYFNGEGTTQNKDMAFYWLTEAAEAGNEQAKKIIAEYF